MKFEFDDGTVIEAADVCEASYKYHSERLSDGSLGEDDYGSVIAKCEWGTYELYSIVPECGKQREYYGCPMKEFHRGTLSDERSCLISCDKIVFSRVVDSERGDFDNYICRYPCNRPTRQLFLEALFKQEVGLSWQFAVRLNDRNQIIESWENRND